MEMVLGAKSTKPGSKATAKRGASAAGRPARVPVGMLHMIDESAQTQGSSFTAVCGEDRLTSLDGAWDDPFPNERCEVCAERQWLISFNAMQADLLK